MTDKRAKSLRAIADAMESGSPSDLVIYDKRLKGWTLPEVPTWESVTRHAVRGRDVRLKPSCLENVQSRNSLAEEVRIGDTIRKTSGDYCFVGTVLSFFSTTKGRSRIVAENSDGIVHIFNPTQVEVIDREQC